MTRYLNFLVTGTQRTGSSVIAENIGAHPHVACGWEWTQHGWYRDKIALAERGLAGDFSWLNANNRAHMAQVVGPNTRCLGFRRLFRSSDKWLLHPSVSPPLWVDRFDAHLRWLARRRDIAVIHVVRGDNIEWIKSKVLARENQAFFGKSYDESPISVNIQESVRRLIAKDWVDARLVTLSGTNPYVRVMYEDFIADNKSALNCVFEMLKCAPGVMPVRNKELKKQSIKPTREYISNFDDLVCALRTRGLARAALWGL